MNFRVAALAIIVTCSTAACAEIIGFGDAPTVADGGANDTGADGGGTRDGTGASDGRDASDTGADARDAQDGTTTTPDADANQGVKDATGAPDVEDAANDAMVDAWVNPGGVWLSPSVVHLVRGSTASLTVSVNVTLYIGDVAVQFQGLPAGVKATGTAIGAGGSGTITFSATTSATLGPAQLTAWVTSATGTSGWGQATLLVQDASGTLDTTFGDGGIARVSFGDDAFRDATQQGIVLLPDGRILLCGTVEIQSAYAVALVRLEGDGSVDTSLNGSGTVTWNPDSADVTAGCGVVASSGRVLVGGFSVHGDDGYDSMLAAAFTSDGGVDPTYAKLGAYDPDFGVDSKVAAVAVAADGTMVATGFSAPNAELYRLTADGAVDPTFGNSDAGSDAGNGLVLLPAGVFVPSVSLLSDGRFIALGTTTSASWLERYSANGVYDGTYGDGGSVQALGALSIGWTTVEPDDSVVVGALAANEDGGASVAIELAHVRADGQLDPAFGDGGTTLTPLPGGDSATLIAIAVGADGKLAAALSFASTPGGSSFSAAVFQPTGVPDMSFGTKGFVTANVGANALASDVAIDPLGRVLVAGSAGDPTKFENDAVVVRYWP